MQQPVNTDRVLRGGSWISHIQECRMSFRVPNYLEYCSNSDGFRTVCSLQPVRREIRVLRNGAWNNIPKGCRLATRSEVYSDARINIIGFRTVCAPKTLPVKKGDKGSEK